MIKIVADIFLFLITAPFLMLYGFIKGFMHRKRDNTYTVVFPLTDGKEMRTKFTKEMIQDNSAAYIPEYLHLVGKELDLTRDVVIIDNNTKKEITL